MLRTTFSRPDLGNPAFATRWETLAAAWRVPVFRTWTWIGCLAEERFPDPVLAEMHDGTGLVALALFNRTRGPLGTTLHLHESGDPALDAVFTEHNGPLAMPGHEAAALIALLPASGQLASRTVLSGLDDDLLAAARSVPGIVSPVQTRPAPLARLGPGWFPGLSRNTRAQLRRSDRAYEALGPLVTEQARDVAQALDWLEALLAFHTTTWSARGIASAFAAAPVQRFARTLITRGLACGHVQVLRISAGASPIGYLMNLHAAGHVGTYQSGFDYAGAPEHGKPGYTCHAAAIRACHAAEYDFLAGDGQYKRSFATHVRNLHWCAWQPRLTLFGAKAIARTLLKR